MVLEIQGLGKSYRNKPVLEDVHVSLERKEFLSLIGPSGSGKSTLLKIIAGLEKADTGTVVFSPKPDLQAPVILVFQDFQLFPHLSVQENVAFGLRARKTPPAQVRERVASVLEELGIDSLAKAYPATLSGGEKQRAALARALVLNPLVLLLDEPFSNLDPNLKGETALFIRSVAKVRETSVVCVTHDFQEAFSMSDRVGVLMEGRLVQTGSPRQVYAEPVNLEVARFTGAVNHVPAHDTWRFFPKPVNQDLLIRPESLRFLPDPQGEAQLVAHRFYGNRSTHLVAWRGRQWEALADFQELTPGTPGRIQFL